MIINDLNLWLSEISNIFIQEITGVNIINNEVLPKGYREYCVINK